MIMVLLILYMGVGSNFGLVWQIELVAKDNLVAHAEGVWGHAPRKNLNLSSSEIAFWAILG